MYTKKVYPSLFDNGEPLVDYYKDGEWIAFRSHGKIVLVAQCCRGYDPLTRAKGFRYWWKHFPDHYCWSLPEALQDALEMAPTSRGVFVNRDGQLCGYEG